MTIPACALGIALAGVVNRVLVYAGNPTVIVYAIDDCALGMIAGSPDALLEELGESM